VAANPDQQQRRYRDNPYTRLWLVPAVLSVRLTVPAMRHIIQNRGMAGHGIALTMAVVFAFLYGSAIASLERIERRAYRYTLILLLASISVLLWHYSR
jgi:uncharacterized membrane protein YbjE (DUF340 family)